MILILIVIDSKIDSNNCRKQNYIEHFTEKATFVTNIQNENVEKFQNVNIFWNVNIFM